MYALITTLIYNIGISSKSVERTSKAVNYATQYLENAKMRKGESLSKEEKDRYTNIIIESTDRLTTLVNNVLNISKIDNHKISIDKSDFNLAEQIREAILSLESEWVTKNIDFDIDLEEITNKE